MLKSLEEKIPMLAMKNGLLEDDSQLVLRWSVDGTNGPGVLDKVMRRFIGGKYEVILGAWGNMKCHSMMLLE